MDWIYFLCSVFLAPDGNGNYLSDLIKMNNPDPGLLAVFSLLGGVIPIIGPFIIVMKRSHSIQEDEHA
ncbi:hypothetical protein ABFG93_12075 [Pseudalkalibacillus hwajinpoensis]|uniref:hypothetical protein n=1 Tax=Guptibacillus hwajinpoensis TaxID=208199 RepID=UPI00325BCF0E